MRSRALIGMILATVTLSPAIHAQQTAQTEEEAWPMESTGDISILVVKERYRIYTDHCASEVPALKPGFDETMQSLRARIRSIGMRLLDTDAFKDMKQQQVSSTLLGALSSELENIRQELEDQDAAQICPETLRSYRGTTDQLLEDFLMQTLAGIRSTAKTLKARSEH